MSHEANPVDGHREAVARLPTLSRLESQLDSKRAEIDRQRFPRNDLPRGTVAPASLAFETQGRLGGARDAFGQGFDRDDLERGARERARSHRRFHRAQGVENDEALPRDLHLGLETASLGVEQAHRNPRKKPGRWPGTRAYPNLERPEVSLTGPTRLCDTCGVWKRLAAWLVTLPFVICFTLVLLVFDPIQRIAHLFGQRPQEIAAGWLQVWLLRSMYLTGVRLEVERSPAVKEHTPYIIFANHQSMLDIPVHGTLLFSNFPKYVSKKSLASWLPSISYNLRCGGNALIERSDREQATQAIRELGQRSQERGVSVVLYPEGTRARAGELGPFKPGGALTLLEAAPDLAVVSVAIDNSWKLMRHNLLPVPFGTRLHVYIGEPVARHAGEDRMGLVQQARTEIENALERWRAGEAAASQG